MAECCALGLDPADATNDFRIVSVELVDGKPKVAWKPKTNRWTGAEIQAVLKGAESLDGDWHEVDKARESDHTYFGSGASDAGDGVVPAGKGGGAFKVAD